MRGRSSSAKARLRSAGYKCNLCGRRLIDAATLERHQKNIHNVSPKDNKVGLRPKPPAQRNKLSIKDKPKVFECVNVDIPDESKPKLRKSKNNYENQPAKAMGDLPEGRKANKETVDVKNGESLLVEKDKSRKDDLRPVEFECPVCARTFTTYFNAHKHIQRVHPVNASGRKVPQNSPDLVQPIRVEYCFRCDSKMKSNEHHSCPKIVEEHVTVIAEFICSGCNQIFVSLKSFDMHVAGLHSDAVDSMFFPTKIEFMNWRLEMERQTSAKYSLYGEYEAKKIYRCNYAKNHTVQDKYTAYFCPSSMVVQEFKKGIQVHFYHKHYDHASNPYTLSSKYKKYSITSFLKNPNEDSTVASPSSVKMEDKDLHSQFKKLMDTIIVNAADVDISVLKLLIEKALEMSAVVTEAGVSDPMSLPKPAKCLTVKEITEMLDMRTVSNKRRRSVDSCEVVPKPAKRTRNKSLFNQSDTKMSPRILNTFSLASNSNSDKSDSGNNFELDSTISSASEKAGSIQNVLESDLKSNKVTKVNNRPASFHESPSFNDSYKDFIDKNFIAKEKLAKNTVKTKLGVFKTSPKKVEHREEVSGNVLVNNKNLRGIKSINPVAKVNEAPKINIISVETSVVKPINVDPISKGNTIKMDALNVSNQLNATKTDSPEAITSKVNTRGFFSRLIDETIVHSINSPLPDPLELDVAKGKAKNLSGEALSRNVSKMNSRRVSSPVVETRNNYSKVDSSRSETKLRTSKLDLTVSNPKINTPKTYVGPGTPKAKSPVLLKTMLKATPKPTFDDSATNSFDDKPSASNLKVTPYKKVKELKYEVREQENDCNILVLKF